MIGQVSAQVSDGDQNVKWLVRGNGVRLHVWAHCVNLLFVWEHCVGAQGLTGAVPKCWCAQHILLTTPPGHPLPSPVPSPGQAANCCLAPQSFYSCGQPLPAIPRLLLLTNLHAAPLPVLPPRCPPHHYEAITDAIAQHEAVEDGVRLLGIEHADEAIGAL